jgi:hypothetical protein
MNAQDLTLRELWALPMEEQQRRRVYTAFGRDHDFAHVGRFFLVEQTTGTVDVVDPRLPWNKPSVQLFSNHRDAAEFARARTSKEVIDEVTARFSGQPITGRVRQRILELVTEELAKIEASWA